MVDLVNQQTATQTAELVFEKTIVSAEQVSAAANESPALDMLEAKLLSRRQRAAPYTYRRPAYLQYIEYA